MSFDQHRMALSINIVMNLVGMNRIGMRRAGARYELFRRGGANAPGAIEAIWASHWGAATGLTIFDGSPLRS